MVLTAAGQRAPVLAVAADAPGIAQARAAGVVHRRVGRRVPRVPPAERENDGFAGAVQHVPHLRVLRECGAVVRGRAAAVLFQAVRARGDDPPPVHLNVALAALAPALRARVWPRACRRVGLGVEAALAVLGPRALRRPAARVEPALEDPALAWNLLRVDPVAEGLHSRREERAILDGLVRNGVADSRPSIQPSSTLTCVHPFAASPDSMRNVAVFLTQLSLTVQPAVVPAGLPHLRGAAEAVVERGGAAEQSSKRFAAAEGKAGRRCHCALGVARGQGW